MKLHNIYEMKRYIDSIEIELKKDNNTKEIRKQLCFYYQDKSIYNILIMLNDYINPLIIKNVLSHVVDEFSFKNLLEINEKDIFLLQKYFLFFNEYIKYDYSVDNKLIEMCKNDDYYLYLQSYKLVKEKLEYYSISLKQFIEYNRSLNYFIGRVDYCYDNKINIDFDKFILPSGDKFKIVKTSDEIFNIGINLRNCVSRKSMQYIEKINTGECLLFIYSKNNDDKIDGLLSVNFNKKEFLFYGYKNNLMSDSDRLLAKIFNDEFKRINNITIPSEKKLLPSTEVQDTLQDYVNDFRYHENMIYNNNLLSDICLPSSNLGSIAYSHNNRNEYFGDEAVNRNIIQFFISDNTDYGTKKWILQKFFNIPQFLIKYMTFNRFDPIVHEYDTMMFLSSNAFNSNRVRLNYKFYFHVNIPVSEINNINNREVTKFLSEIRGNRNINRVDNILNNDYEGINFDIVLIN